MYLLSVLSGLKGTAIRDKVVPAAFRLRLPGAILLAETHWPCYTVFAKSASKPTGLLHEKPVFNTMPRLLYTYLTNEILAPFYASLVILTSILFLGELVTILDNILRYDISLADFFRLYAYISPEILLFSLPMASMMGVILGTSQINNENELMVLKACGISLYRMLPPVVLVALGTSLLTGAFSVYLIPAGNRAKAELAFELAREKLERSMQEKKFSKRLGDIVLYTDRIDQQTGAWSGVYISDLRDPAHPVTIIAQGGSFSADSATGILSLSLHDGILNRTAANVVESINFDSYDMRLPLENPSRNPLARTGKSTMTQKELLTEAARLGKNTPTGATYLNEFNKRLALPVTCFILTLLGFPLGFLSGPHHRTVGIPLGLAIFILYYVLLTGAKAVSESLTLPAAVAMWLPSLFFFVITLVFLRSVARETHTLALEKFYDFTYAFLSRFRSRGGGEK
jgi:lipopolysaccharide export system permease protein